MSTDDPLPYRFTLTLGDENRDSHGITEPFWYKANKPHTSIFESYAIASKLYDLDLMGQCNESGEQYWSSEFHAQAVAIFANVPEALRLIHPRFTGQNGLTYASIGSYLELFFHIAKLVDTDLHWAESDIEPNINLGGSSFYAW